MSSVVKGKASSAGSSPRMGKPTPFTASASLASASFTKNLLSPGPTPIAARPEWGTGSALQSTWIRRLIPVARSFKHVEEASEVRNGLAKCRTRQVDTMDLEEDTSGDGESGSEELQSLEGRAVFGYDRKNGISHKYDKQPQWRALNAQAEKPNMVKCVGSSSILRSTNPDSCRTVECTDQIKPSTSLMASKVKFPKAARPRHERSITLGKLPSSSDPKIVASVAMEDDARTHGQASAPAAKTHVVNSPDRLVSSVWFARITGKDGCMGAASRAATHSVKSSEFCRNLSSTPFYHQNGLEENIDNKAIRFFPPLKSGEQWPGTPKPSGLTPLRIPWNGKSGRGNGQDVPEELPLLTPINVPLKRSGKTERLQVRGTEEVERTSSLVRSFSLFQSLEEPRQTSTSSCTRSLPSELINDLYSKNHGAHRHEGKSSPGSQSTKSLYLDSLPLDGDAACSNNSLEGASYKNVTNSLNSNKNEIVEEKCFYWSGPNSNGNGDTAEPSKLRVTSFQFSCLDDLPKRHERNEFKIAARRLKTPLETEISQRELGTTQTILEANSKQVQDAQPAFVHPTGVPCSMSVTFHEENNVLRPQGSQQWLQRWSSPNCNSQRLKVLEQAKERYRTGK